MYNYHVNIEIIKTTEEENVRNKYHVFQWVPFVNNVYILRRYVGSNKS
jgi:hypothetical protein